MPSLIDTTLRDGLQCLWSSRLEGHRILPIARSIDLAGYEAVDFMALVQFEVSVKHLKENPWTRAQSIMRVMKRTPLIAHVRSRSLTTFDIVADDVIRLWIERLAASGFRRLMILDALHDESNIAFSLKLAKEYGFHVTTIIFYTISPVHTDLYYSELAHRMARLGADAVCIRDPSGLLTPERTQQLVSILKRNLSGIPLQLKSHCTTGLAEDCYIEALRAGVDSVFTATTPLANGPSVPAAEAVMKRAKAVGASVKVDTRRLKDVADYFREVAEEDGKPLGCKVSGESASQYQHQVPGGMISFLKDQLRSLGLEGRLPAVLEEIPRVRADFGYPVVVTPISQFIGAQAMLNVVQGERYRTIPVEVQKYIRGYFGKPEAPLLGALVDRVRSFPDPMKNSPNDEGVIERAKKKFGPFASDDELLLYLLFRPEKLDGVIERRKVPNSPIGQDSIMPTLRSLLSLGEQFTTVSVKTQRFSFSASR